MDKEIEKAIHLTQRLRAVMLQAVALEKEIEEWEASDEYLQSVVGDMKEAMLALTTRPSSLNEDATDILSQIDQLLYALMDLGGDEAWKDEGEFEQRTQLKLGEALKDRMLLATSLNLSSQVIHSYTNQPPIVDWRVEIHREKGIG